MTADVYAGDDFRQVGSATGEAFMLRVTADAQPDVLQRVAAQFAFLNCAPLRFSLQKQGNDTVEITAVFHGCSAHSLELARRKLQQLTCVTGVALGAPRPGPVSTL